MLIATWHAFFLFILHSLSNRYMISQLLNSKDKKVAGYLKKYTFHIIPIMNPDGFVVSQTSNRMHRKNTQPNPSSRCLGTDSTFFCPFLFFFLYYITFTHPI